MKLNLPAPNWDTLVGGTTEAAWIADRDRKFGALSTATGWILQTADALEARNALFVASREVLLAIPLAATWYISLAGFSLKTLSNISVATTNRGMTQSAGSLVKWLASSAPNMQLAKEKQANVDAFVKWINEELTAKFPAQKTREAALIHVAAILGGRIIGQGQNTGGDDAVVLVKSLLVGNLAHRYQLELFSAGKWSAYNPSEDFTRAGGLRFAGKLLVEFPGGGNRPDIKVSLAKKLVAVGEIKGRKDLSNVWESWMPQVVAHMETWKEAHPNAARLFFGTVIEKSMIKGESSAGIKRRGLRALYEAGYLTGVYNISLIIEKSAKAEYAFKAFTQELSRLVEEHCARRSVSSAKAD